MRVEEYKRTDLTFTDEELKAIETTKNIIDDLTSIADTFGIIELEGNDFDKNNFEEAFSLLECLFYEIYHKDNKIFIDNEENY